MSTNLPTHKKVAPTRLNAPKMKAAPVRVPAPQLKAVPAMNSSRKSQFRSRDTFESVPVSDQTMQHDDEWREIPDSMKEGIMSIVEREAKVRIDQEVA
jgi:hypothetical protein